MSKQALLATNIKELPLFRRGKVRDVYDMGEKLLIIASDRLSAFDVVMPNGIPDKGVILNQMSLFWFDLIKDVVKNHLLVTHFSDFPAELKKYPELEGRSVIVRKAERFDVECVVRGYLTGSGLADYKKTGKVCGIPLPAGMVESQKLPEPLFTPAFKAEQGDHDENIDYARTEELVGSAIAKKLKDISIAIYKKARDYAESKGIIIADTKFEFGIIDGEVTLIDEILSPDSSRFWPKADYQVGKVQNSFDKQFVRDYLNTLDWNKKAPGPTLPDEVIEKTLAKYREAYALLCQ
ncbi:MAG: phosphoribosylaminoimidazolesuccinocarboxamide synthase [Elusimicrobia bacterium RIFOXYB2_FULL_49_7]|nr:MAG: phosphoribosylaminoimidazolesuccinocarboxamide synthase [Elusimicrobia bacterium RIFOXYB2_FULL_49_7]